jgi:hypothetical protein
VNFICQESRGHWHNRARALMCRRLKHCTIYKWQRQLLVDCILGRLHEGRFTEQFRDQLRLALHLDRPACLRAATESLSAPKWYARHLAAWLLARAAN